MAGALLVSFVNTLLVSAMGIVAATGLGLLIGIMRLSVNWLIRQPQCARLYRVRAQYAPSGADHLLVFQAVLQTLPPPRRSIVIPGGLLLNIRGLYVPSAVMAERASTLSLVSAAALVLTPLVWRLPLKGGRLGAKALLLPLAAVGLFAAGIEHIEFPMLTGFNITGGALQIPPGARGAVGRTVDLFRGLLHRRDRAQRHRGGAEGPAPRRPRARSLHAGRAVADSAAASGAHHGAATHEPVSQPDQEHHARRRGRLSRDLPDLRRHGHEPGRQGDRDNDHRSLARAIFLTVSLIFSAFMNWYNSRIALVER